MDIPADLKSFVNEYTRVDEDESVIDTLIFSAIEYLKNAGVEIEAHQESFLYKLAIGMLVTQWYEERKQNISTRDAAVMENGVQTIILQLK
ncbi:MAG TPA: head-tail connector protein [Pseudogracilibacillus sp.]|nr:head-tail connector protein [Pseudogracilibacillus sp.]